MKSLFKRTAAVCAGSILLLNLAGCASSGESASVDRLTQNVGNYSPPPGGVTTPRVGVPQMSMEGGGGGSMGFRVAGNTRLENLAADQLSTLLYQTDRFSVIERAQLEQLLKEQDLEGVVNPDELSAMGQVRGTDYLCLGKVTNFEVRIEERDSGMRLGSRLTDRAMGRDLKGVRGGFDRKNTTITISCGVDLRLTDPETGEVWVAEQSDFNRELRADSLGLDLDIFQTRADAEVRVTEDDAGKLLRLALDQTIREMLPDIDRKLRQQWQAETAEAADSE